MSKVTILTDSSAYLPQPILEELGIAFVPLTLNWDGDSYRDGIDITGTEFYTRLGQSQTIPTTSQVPVSVYQHAVKELLDQGREVLILPISSGISGTYESAVQAKAEFFKNDPVDLLDTKLVSMALGFMVMTVARAAKEGASLAECKALAQACYPKIGVYFTVDTLKYLNKGGRINTAKRLLGTALSIKPVLEIREGKIELVESVISRKKALKRLIDLTEKSMDGRQPVRLSVFHALCESEALALQEECVARFSPVETVLTEVSPVVGSHTGPGTISIANMAG